MMQSREINRKKRHFRIRKKIKGTPERPRVSVRRTLKHMTVQLVDDINQVTIVGMSTCGKKFASSLKSTKSVEAAKVLGEAFAEKLKEKGITKVCFDRGGYLYHGRIKAFAEALREKGIIF